MSKPCFVWGANEWPPTIADRARISMSASKTLYLESDRMGYPIGPSLFLNNRENDSAATHPASQDRPYRYDDQDGSDDNTR